MFRHLFKGEKGVFTVPPVPPLAEQWQSGMFRYLFKGEKGVFTISPALGAEGDDGIAAVVGLLHQAQWAKRPRLAILSSDTDVISLGGSHMLRPRCTLGSIPELMRHAP